jgi:hypothetical protein
VSSLPYCITSSQIAAAKQCIYRNHLFIRAMLAMFDEDEWVPPHLAPANAAADEIEAAAGTEVSPVDHDKVRCVPLWRGGPRALDGCACPSAVPFGRRRCTSQHAPQLLVHICTGVSSIISVCGLPAQ